VISGNTRGLIADHCCVALLLLLLLLCCLAASQQGPQIVELLKKNPTVAIPVIIVRLEQKEAEWLRVSGALWQYIWRIKC
jgi:hypothetical protein